MKFLSSFDLKNIMSQREYSWGFGVFSFFLLALISSQSGMDFFAGLMFLTALFWTARYRKQNWSWPKLGLLPLFGVWITVIILGITLNPVQGSQAALFFEFRWMIDIYVMSLFIQLFIDDKRTFTLFAKLLTACSGLAVVFYFLGYNPLTENVSVQAENLANFSRHRAHGLFDHAMPLAHSYGPLFLVFVGYWLTQRTQWKSISKWVYAAIILTAITLVLTFTRGVWIGLAAGLIVMGFMLNRKLGLITLTGLFVLSLGVFIGSQKVRDRIMVTVNMTNQGDHERITLWKANWEMIKDHPLIGIGYSQNKARLREYYDRMNVPAGYFEGHAHNEYVHFLSGTGVLGLGCYLVFLFVALRATLLAFKNSSAPADKGIALGIFGALICFMVGSLTESNFSIGKNRYMILFLIAWGLYLHAKSAKALNSKPQA